jgi:hypothetical protein
MLCVKWTKGDTDFKLKWLQVCNKYRPLRCRIQAFAFFRLQVGLIPEPLEYLPAKFKDSSELQPNAQLACLCKHETLVKHH